MKPVEVFAPSLAKAESLLLAPAGLDIAQVLRVVEELFVHKVDFGDAYFEYASSESWSLEEGKVKGGSFSIDQGVGVRAVAGEKTAFSYSDEITADAIREAVKTTRAIAAAGNAKRVKLSVGASAGKQALYGALDPLATLDSNAKVALLEKIERMTRAKDPRVKKVMANLSSEYSVVLIVRSDGRIASDVRPLVRMNVQAMVEQNGRREDAHMGGGGRTSLAMFDDAWLDRIATECVKSALTNLDARPAPAGPTTVVLGSGWPGILLH
jgi:TldD protein